MAYTDTSIIPLRQLEEINQYRQVQDRNRRLVSRTFLFKYLKDNYNLSDFTFSYTDIKRQTLKKTDIDFNISYSKDLIAIAVSTKNKIGVDIEYINYSFDIESIIPTCMNSEELKTFELLQNSEKLNYFYSLWTYKEALVKLLGGGLYLDLREMTNLKINSLNICKYQPFISNDYSLSVVKFNK